MKKVPLTHNRFALVDDEDYDKVINLHWRVVRNHVLFEQSPTPMPDIILGVAPVNFVWDHKDGDGLNNQRFNLRLASRSQNRANSKIPSNNTTGYKGVTWTPSGYRAQIGVNRRVIWLGRYPRPELAAKAYNDAATKYFGEFAKLNLIENENSASNLIGSNSKSSVNSTLAKDCESSTRNG